MLTNFASIMLGLAISANAPDADAATEMGIPTLIFSILFGGFYISINSLPIVADWIPSITIFRWAYQAMCINEFAGLTFTCDSADTSQCILTGEEVLATLDFSGHTTAYPCFGLGMVLVGLMCLAFALLQLSTITYTPLGYTGNAYTSNTKGANSNDSGGEVVADGDVGGGASASGGYEMVSTSTAGVRVAV